MGCPLRFSKKHFGQQPSTLNKERRWKREWLRRLNIPRNATVFLSIRGWSTIYRQESILEAFAQALPLLKFQVVLVFKSLMRHPTDRTLYEKKMRDLAEKLGIAPMLCWMEEVPFHLLPEVYSFADVVLNYPPMDALPITFLEAACCERPVISCRLPAYIGTFAEKYFHLISPEDLSQLSKAIVEFVNQGWSDSHGRLPELRWLVCRDYDERVASERLFSIYQRVLSSQQHYVIV